MQIKKWLEHKPGHFKPERSSDAAVSASVNSQQGKHKKKASILLVLHLVERYILLPFPRQSALDAPHSRSKTLSTVREKQFTLSGPREGKRVCYPVG
jgi:hypothetical protein